jgi:Cys-rich protein (TIGR01571 family)
MPRWAFPCQGQRRIVEFWPLRAMLHLHVGLLHVREKKIYIYCELLLSSPPRAAFTLLFHLSPRSWFCSCFQLGQIAEKLRNTGSRYCLSMQQIVWITVILWILSAVLSVVTSQPGDESSDNNNNNTYHFASIFLFIVACQLRTHVRRARRIDGDGCGDCCATFWCGPCAMTQMVGEMWSQPEVTPGCDCSERAASLP